MQVFVLSLLFFFFSFFFTSLNSHFACMKYDPLSSLTRPQDLQSSDDKTTSDRAILHM